MYGSTVPFSVSKDDQASDVNLNQMEHPSLRIYHERQSKQLCALHALNNLFQDAQAFKKQELDAICKELSPDSKIFNPHRSTLGLGCYDINVIISALAKKDFDVKWFDKRKDLTCLSFSDIFGLILNVPNTPTNGLFSNPFNHLPIQAQIWSSQKHWITVRRIGTLYYNLDSKLISPICIGDEDALLQYLNSQNSIDQVEILIVVSKDVSDENRWLKSDNQF